MSYFRTSLFLSALILTSSLMAEDGEQASENIESTKLLEPQVAVQQL